jgi:hypothetical protein
MKNTLPQTPLLARFAIGTLLIVAISLAVFMLVMFPPLNELGLMALYLGITGSAGAGAGRSGRGGEGQRGGDPAGGDDSH